MSTHRLNIEFPSDDFTYLKMLCPKKGISIKEFVVPLILRAIEEEEDTLLIGKAEQRLKNMDETDLIPIKDVSKKLDGMSKKYKVVFNKKYIKDLKHIQKTTHYIE